MHVFTLPAENWNELSIDKQVIRHLILKHRSFVDHLITLEDYYEGKHKILNDKNRENKLVCNHAKDISDTASSYFIGNPVTYKAQTDITDLTDKLEYAGADEADGDNGLDLSIFGRAYEYIYTKKDETDLMIKNLSPANTFVVYDDTIEQNELFAVYYYAKRDDSDRTDINGTGRAAKSTVYPSNVATEYTDNGKTSICWRGKENFWGNIWKFVYGVNIWGNGKMAGGQPYICKDFNFAENKNSDNYEAAGFTVAAKAGYISAMGYSTKCDWLFMASECLGNSALPVGDYTYITELLNGYRIALLGGTWYNGVYAGPFSWGLDCGVGYRARSIGGRLVYIPTKDSDVYLAAIASWKAQMAAA